MQRREWLALGAILLLAAALRFWGINHNVWIDENKVIKPTIDMVESGQFPLLVAPTSYYPHLTHHILALVFWPIEASAPDTTLEEYHPVARVVAALFNIATVGVLYVIGRRMLGHWSGVLTAFFLAVMPLHVKYSHFMQVDVFATFFMTLALWSGLKLWDEGTPKWYALTGIFVGAAGASQFWGLAAGTTLLLAHAKWAAAARWSFKEIARPAFLLGLILIPITFSVLSPHIVLNWGEYQASVEKLRMRGEGGDLGYTRPNLLWPLYTRSYDWGLNFTRAGIMWESNVVTFALAAAGVVIAAWRRSWKVLVMLGVLAAVFYLAINGTLRLYAVKRLLPLGPFIALLAAYAVFRIPRGKLLAYAVAAAAIVIALVQGVGFDRAYAHGSVHAEAVVWAEQNIPKGSVVLQHLPLRLLDPGSEDWKIVRMDEVYASFSATDPEAAKDRAKSLDQWIKEDGVEYIAMDWRMVGRYTADPTSRKLYPETIASYRAFYADVRERGKLIYEARPEFGKRAGARVEIYDVRHLH